MLGLYLLYRGVKLTGCPEIGGPENGDRTILVFNRTTQANSAWSSLHGYKTGTAVTTLELCLADIGQWMAANRLKMNSDKTELLWTGTSSRLKSLTSLLLAVNIGSFTVIPTDNARLLGVLVSADLLLQKHVSTVSAWCFYQLCQLRCVRRSLDQDSVATLVQAFVSSRVDYCCSLLIGSPKFVMDKFQKVLNAAARVISNSRKYDRGLTYTRRHEIHWLDIPERIRFRTAVTVHRSLSEWSGTSIPYWTVHPYHTEQVELSSTLVIS